MNKSWINMRARRAWKAIESDLDDRKGFYFHSLDQETLEELRASQVKVIEEALREAHDLGRHEEE